MKITELQALNLLAKKYEGDESHQEHYDKIKSLLLADVRSPEDKIFIAELLKDQALAQYEILNSKFSDDSMQQITTAIKTQIKTNLSGNEVVLSVGESLLMVINACKKAKIDANIITQLKTLYLDGVKTEADKEFIIQIKDILADQKQYRVSNDPKVANQDPSRRYFETHLSSHLLKSKAESLETDKLRAVTKNLKDNLWTALASNMEEKTAIEYILDGNMHSSLNKYQLEYAELINKLKSHNYHGLSPKACDNLCEIAKSTILSTLNTQFDKSMPADIYEDSIFTMGMDGRGRIVKKEHDTVRTGAKGIMRSTSPMPRNDLAGEGDTEEYEVPLYQDAVDEHGEPILGKDSKVKRIPVTKRVMGSDGIEKEVAETVNRVRMVVSPFQRSADQATFMIESQWSQHLFGRQTQVYSNGISSTTLATIRNILMQKREGNPFHGEYFQEYMSAFAALMIYNSGGHSLFEIFEVFKLPQLQEVMEASGCSDLLQKDELMQQWLLKDNPAEFDKAMDETIAYMEQIMNRRILNAQLHQWAKDDGTLKASGTNKLHDVREKLAIESESVTNQEGLSLHRAVLTLDATEFTEFLNTTENNALNVLNSSKYTPLMVAAQIGKLEHVQELVKAGADLTKELKQDKRKHGLTALELAIKSEKYPVVQYLLEQPGLRVKKENLIGERFDERSLRDRAPALYFACRQSDTRILQSVVEHGRSLTLKDKILAIQETVKFENIDGLVKLINLLSPKELKNLPLKEKQNIISMATTRGNIALLDVLLNSSIAPDQKNINYNELLQIANTKGYLPLIRLVLSDASKNQTLPKNSLLDNMMETAVARGQYDMAVLMIIYGANPDKIGINNPSLIGFTYYLRATPPEHLNTFFSDSDRALIAQRSEGLKEKYTERTSGIWRSFVDLLVGFLNMLPGVNLGGYYQKTELMARLSFQVITNEEPKTDYELGYGETPEDQREVSPYHTSQDEYSEPKKVNTGLGRASCAGMFGSYSRQSYENTPKKDDDRPEHNYEAIVPKKGY